MTRVTICREGQDPGFPQILEPGAVKFDPEKEYFVSMHNLFHDPDMVVGKAREVRREDDGTITAEVGDLEIPIGYGVTIYGRKVVSRMDENDVVRVESCELMSLFLDDSVNWRRTE